MVNNIIVFDLDETLGYFTQLGIIWECLISKIDNNLSNFFKLLDLYPEFLRPNILNILNYIKKKKKQKKCDMVIIYTNNNGPQNWSKMIGYYFNYKLNFKIIDKVIGAKSNLNCRTSNQKLYSDLRRCLNLDIKTKMCFVDNKVHKGMLVKNITYLLIPPYFYSLKNTDILTRINLDEEYLKKIINVYNYEPKFNTKLEDDFKIGKLLLLELKKFFHS